MRFAEELLLLLLNEDAGTVAVPEANLGFALAGARLMDLAIEGRIDTDLAQLVAVDSTPLGDDLLDPVLTAVAAETTVRGAEFWVRRLAAEADGIEDAVLARLLDAGILEMDESGMHLSPQPAHARRYPIVDGKTEEEVRLRIMRVLFGSDVPAPRDVVIICLADACGFFERTLSAEERRECAAWPQGKPISGKAALQRIVADQLGTILANVSPNAYFDDLTTFLDLLLLTRIAKIQPMFLHRRKYDAAWRRVNELFELTMREHRPGGPLADAGDLVNDVLALHDTDPQFLPETDLLMAAMGPFIAGLDTAAITTSFTLYEAIKRPQLAERLRTEADALFAGGKTPTTDALGRLDAMHRLTLEVLRFYPSVPGQSHLD